MNPQRDPFHHKLSQGINKCAAPRVLFQLRALTLLLRLDLRQSPQAAGSF
jgi:hypothetical protein